MTLAADLNESQPHQYIFMYLKLLRTLAYNQKCNLARKDTCISALLVRILQRATGVMTWDNEHVMTNTEPRWKTLRPTRWWILNRSNSVSLRASRRDSRIFIRAVISRQVWRWRRFALRSRPVPPPNSFLSLTPLICMMHSSLPFETRMSSVTVGCCAAGQLGETIIWFHGLLCPNPSWWHPLRGSTSLNVILNLYEPCMFVQQSPYMSNHQCLACFSGASLTF